LTCCIAGGCCWCLHYLTMSLLEYCPRHELQMANESVPGCKMTWFWASQLIGDLHGHMTVAQYLQRMHGRPPLYCSGTRNV
jgi:hypothetical protein